MAIVCAKCTHCGAILQVDSATEVAVCQNCNTVFAVEKAIQNYYGGAAPAQPQTVVVEQPKKSNTALIIVIVILAVLLLAGGGFFLYQSLSDKDTDRDDDERESVSDVDPDALEGRYVSVSNLYSIEFEDDFTCRWYQTVHGNESYFVGTYEKDGDVYILRMEGGQYSYNTEFIAEPVEDGFIITGGLVDGELFVKD